MLYISKNSSTSTFGHTRCLLWTCFFLLSCFSTAFAESDVDPCQLFEDLLTVDAINQKQADRLPTYYNNLLQGGYFSMPSTRMGCEGEIGFGYASLPPYRHWSLRCQYTPFLELSGNYRVFCGVDDPILTAHGFGDFADKGINIKLALWQTEDTDYRMPGFAIGAEDIMGTRAFQSYYCVFTQIIPKWNLEASLGWGYKRIRGFFGGVSWMPLRHRQESLLQSLAIVAEYDAIPYRDEAIERHPKGRVKNSPINYGIKWRWFDSWDFACSHIRGKAFSFSASTFYNFGTTKGLLPKKDNPVPYQAPIDTEPLGGLRTEELLTQELLFAFNQQRFTILRIELGYEPLFSDECPYQDSEGSSIETKKILRLRVINEAYRSLTDVKERLDRLVASLAPQDVDKVIVVLECEAFPIQEYHYEMPYVQRYAERQMGTYELDVITPAKNLPLASTYCQKNSGFMPLFSTHRHRFDYIIFPKTETLFGSARGKFKYAVGLSAAMEGFLPDDTFWRVCLGWLPISKLYHLNSVDKLNPSQLINVRTDAIRYYQNKHPTLDEAYLQKNWAMGKGWFSRASLGYFEMAYGGVAGQLLYYPVNSFWAFGLEGAIVKKRHYTGISFTDKIRKLDGFEVTHRHFLGSQGFATLYLHLEKLSLDFKVKAGKFLANDWGARFEFMRYFPSGMELSFWYTVTNGHDIINGQIYYDKGVSITLPIDMFYMRSERDRWGYSISAWLRDVGAVSATGRDLYDAIRSQRAIR
jgi:hypothetical protein